VFPRALFGLTLVLGALFAGMSLVAPGDRPGGPPPVVYEDYPEITPRDYLCYRSPGAVTIDGRLDEPAWRAAPWSEAFVDIEGDRRPAPRHRTRVKMLWDDRHLYIAARLDEPHVWGTLTRHDSVIFHDNDFEVFLDPDGDSHLYAELELNALNTTWDLLLSKPYKDGGKAIDAWEVHGLRTAVHVEGTLNDPRDTDRGWSVEIAWPWRSLAEIGSTPAPPRDGDVWRINFSRVEWRHEVVGGLYRKVKGLREDNWVWSPQGVIDMHRPERWGRLHFTTAAPGAGRVRPDGDARVRHLLHRVYYAQRDYRKARGRWARRLGELGLSGPEYAGLQLEATATAWECGGPGPGGRKRWHIRSDARIWAD
jgi:Carbohydrate family 9 binding domain-like